MPSLRGRRGGKMVGGGRRKGNAKGKGNRGDQQSSTAEAADGGKSTSMSSAMLRKTREKMNAMAENFDFNSLAAPDPFLRGPKNEERRFERWSEQQIDDFIVRGVESVCDPDFERDGSASDSEVQVSSAFEQEQEQRPTDGSNGEEKNNVDDDKGDEEGQNILEKDGPALEGNPVSSTAFSTETPFCKTRKNDNAKEANVDEDDLDVAFFEMPEPRAMRDVYNTEISGADAPNSLISKLLNPDAGGSGRNTDGLGGLLATEESQSSPRARLRNKLRYMREKRAVWREDNYARDARGRKIRGARQFTQEDLQNGSVPRNMSIDKNKSAAHRRHLVAKMRGEKATKQEVFERDRSTTHVDFKVVETDSDGVCAAESEVGEQCTGGGVVIESTKEE